MLNAFTVSDLNFFAFLMSSQSLLGHLLLSAFFLIGRNCLYRTPALIGNRLPPGIKALALDHRDDGRLIIGERGKQNCQETSRDQIIKPLLILIQSSRLKRLFSRNDSVVIRYFTVVDQTLAGINRLGQQRLGQGLVGSHRHSF